MSMIEITADIEAIIKEAIPSFVATVTEDGTLNLSSKVSLTVRHGVLYFTDLLASVQARGPTLRSHGGEQMARTSGPAYSTGDQI